MQTITAQNIKEHFNIALIISRFNEHITRKLYDGSIARLQELGFAEDQVTSLWVPGAVEIPLMAQQLANTQKYEAIICLGAVIRGETTHYDYVCQQVSHGCQQVGLNGSLPIIFGVLTTENDEQAMDRVGGQHGHKGRDAVDTAIEMISLMRQVKQF